MTIKGNAQEILDRRLSDRTNEQEGRNEAHAQRVRKQHLTLRKLLSGEPIGARDGREFFWELVANAEAMSRDPMTGNAKTYFNLGERKWATHLLDIAMEVNIDLFQKMQKEAITRKQSGGTE